MFLPNRLSVMSRLLACTLLLAFGLSLGGCAQMFYLFNGPDAVKAQFKIPKKSRVLVFADRRPGRDVPLEIPDLLSDRIILHLYQYKAADNFVAAARLAEMRKSPIFADMSIPDVARKMDADIVIYIDILNFQLREESGGQVTSGVAEAAVKVVDRDGKRLWPTDEGAASPLGQSVTAEIEQNMADVRNMTATREELIKRMTTRIGRLFHDWSSEDREIAK